MDVKKKDGIFRMAGIFGLVLLLVFFIWSRNRGTDVAKVVSDSGGHDHANPAEHGDVKGKHLEESDKGLKASGKIIDGKRIVDYEAFKFGFAPDPLVVFSGETVVLKLKSRDIEHGMMIPEIDFNSSIPAGKVVRAEFKVPEKPGKYPIFCSVFCGTDHGDMQGALLVLPQE